MYYPLPEILPFSFLSFSFIQLIFFPSALKIDASQQVNGRTPRHLDGLGSAALL